MADANQKITAHCTDYSIRVISALLEYFNLQNLSQFAMTSLHFLHAAMKRTKSIV